MNGGALGLGLDTVLLIMTVLVAVVAVWTKILRHAVIFLGIFSFICSFLYLYYGAPDVAIAEAVIGSGLVMLLYLTAIKRYRTYSIIVAYEQDERIEDARMHELAGSDQGRLLQEIERFCLSRELEPEIVYSREEVDTIVEDGRYDLIVQAGGNELTVYGRSDNFLVDELEMLLILHSSDTSTEFVRIGGET
ncbi:MAG: Na(+)/H(+) antiporter subunit B [Spirochaetota bacterium]